jgi:hypothetical protein
MARMKRSEIKLTGCQIKSIEILRNVCEALDTIEKQAGICSVMIRFDDCFICPDIDIDLLNRTPMEQILQALITRMRKDGKAK